MNHKRLWSALPALTALATLLAACGGAAQTPQSPTAAPAAQATTAPAPTTAPAATEAPAPTTAPAATEAPTEAAMTGGMTPADVDAIDLTGKNVEVTYWHNRPQKDQDLLQSMLDEFNATNPYGIKATAEIGGASYNDVYTKVNAAIAAGQPPEMSVAYQNQAAFYRAQDAVIDLTPFINSEKYGLSKDDLADYFPTFLASDANPQFGGERLGFPTQRSMAVMYYNADALKALGYDAPPADWATFEEAACKFSDPANEKYGLVMQHDVSNLAGMIFANGGQILADDGSAYVFNSQAGVDAVSLIQKLFSKQCAAEIPPSERYGEQNRFASGNVLFVFGSSSGLPFYADAISKGANFKFDIALFPHSGEPAVDLYGASISVYKTTPEKELASWLVLKFLGEKAQTVKWASETGYLPVRQSAKDEVIANFKANPLYGPVADTYAKMFDWIPYAKVESPVAGYDPVRALLDSDVLTVAMTDPNADPKQLLDDAVAKSNEILAENAPKQ